MNYGYEINQNKARKNISGKCMYIFDFPYPVVNTTNVSFPSTIDLIADNCLSLKGKQYFASIDDNAMLISIFSPGLFTTEDASAHSQNREEI